MITWAVVFFCVAGGWRPENGIIFILTGLIDAWIVSMIVPIFMKVF